MGPASSPGRYVGRIKSFNAKNAFGFIDCPAAYERWHRDVFIHKKWMGDLEVGAEISFFIEPNKEGMPQARDILHLDGRPPGPGEKGKGKGKQKKI